MRRSDRPLPGNFARRRFVRLGAWATGLALLPTSALGATTVPDADRSVTILVVGDSLAAQLGYTLDNTFAADPAVQVLNRGRASTGLVRDDFYDWPAALDRLLTQHEVDIAVVSVGMNDRQPITAGGAVHPRFGDSWHRLYGERVDRMMQRLVGAGITAYWMGMPASGGRSFSQGMRTINAVFEARAFANRVTFVPTWDLTTDAAGNYTPYGQDAEGRTGRLRDSDGFHLTRFGSRVLAGRLLEAMGPALGAAAP